MIAIAILILGAIAIEADSRHQRAEQARLKAEWYADNTPA